MKKESSKLAQAARDYESIEKALSLQQGNSSGSAEPLFQRWAGTSSESFFESLTKQHALELFKQNAHGSAGLDDLELDIMCETIKPGSMASGTIRYGTNPTPFGDALVALSHHGVCAFWFGGELAELSSQWSGAEFKEDKPAVAGICERIFAGGSEPVPVHLRGTAFQISVWLGLLSLPMGSLSSYQAVASQIGRPEATRAVASAIARNGICYLVPCHRVVQGSGASGEFRWGALRKQAMIGWEAAKVGR